MTIPRDDYMGEPDYPSPWTTKHPREGLRDLDEARIVSLAPDVCLTPVGSAVCAIPYPIVDFCGHDKNYTSSVRFTRKKAMVMRSRTTHVHGDKAGVRKGIKSGTVADVCIPVEHADLVRAEGSEVIRHLDRFDMNNGNTPGEAVFVRSTRRHDAPADTDPVPGSLKSQSSADESQVMSDATPEQPVMGAQYAEASGGAALAGATAGSRSVPQMRSTYPAGQSGLRSGAVPQRLPSGLPSRPPSTVITPGPDQAPNWHKKPPHRIPSIVSKVGRFARFGIWAARAINVVGTVSMLVIPDNGANLSDFLPQDDYERRIKDAFDEGVKEGWDSWEMREWAMEERLRHRQALKEEPQTTPHAVPLTKGVRVDEEEGSQKNAS